MQIDNSDNAAITSNVFYDAWVFGVEVEEQTKLTSFTFTDNLIIGISERVGSEGQELVAAFATYTYISPSAAVIIQNNQAYGASHGFALPHTTCDELETHNMKNNTAGSCDIGFILNKKGHSSSCLGFSYARAFLCGIGQICGPPSIEHLKYSKFIMAENGRSVTLKIGASEGGHNHVAQFNTSYIAAIARPTCSDCYSGSLGNRCSEGQGVRLFSASANGEVMPKKFGGGFDVICKQEVFSTKAYLYDVTFDNFRHTYSGSLAGCGNNSVFRPHGGASDQTAGHYLYDCPCLDCEDNSYVKMDPPNPAGFGWFGGCGELHCTGKKNYMVQDRTGDFLGFKGALVPNSDFANHEVTCNHKENMNGSVCTTVDGSVDFGTLEYENVDVDRQTRIMWPVELKYDASNYWTKTNGWREWEWFGREPRNKRFGRFISNVRLNQFYNMTYTAFPPKKLEIQLQPRSQDNSVTSYVKIRLHYPFPNMIEVHKIEVNSTNQKARKLMPQRPILKTDSGFRRALNTSVCGDNLYDFENYTIIFVVTEDPSCFLRISLKETIQLTTHFAITEAEFFASDGPQTNFINNLAALLLIQDTSRIKIVGVKSGSVEIIAAITPEDSDSSTTVAGDATMAEVQTRLGSTIGTASYNSALGSGVGTVLTSTATYYEDPDLNGSDDDNDVNIALIAGISVASVAVLVAIIVLVVYVLRRRAKVSGHLDTDDSLSNEKDGGEKNPSFLSFGSTHQAPLPASSAFKIKEGASEDYKLEVQDIEEAV